MTTTNVPLTGVVEPGLAAPRNLRRLITELATFGGIGAVAFVVDAGGFNLLRATVLADHVITAKIIAVVAATTVAWIGNRYITYRSRAKDRVGREVLLFLAVNALGMGIATGCLAVSHYVLGFQSVVADNIAGNLVGVALGTIARLLFYRFLVFRTPAGDPLDAAPLPETVH